MPVRSEIGREFSELLVALSNPAEVSADWSFGNQASRGGCGKKIREIGLKSRKGGPKLSLTLRLSLNVGFASQVICHCGEPRQRDLRV